MIRYFTDLPKRERVRTVVAATLGFILVVIFVVGVVTGRIRLGAGGIVLSITPASTEVSLEGAQVFEVRLETGGNDVVAVTTNLDFDPAILSFVSADMVDSVFPYEVHQEVAPGQVRVTRGIPGNGVIADGVGFRGNNGLVFRVTFQALRAGTTTISFAPDSRVVLDDGTGQAAPLSQRTATVTIAPAPDTTPPGQVAQLAGDAGNESVVLSWVNPADQDLRGIKIQRREGTTAPSSPTDGTTVLDDQAAVPAAPASAEDPGLQSGTSYSYRVFAYDQAGNFNTGQTITVTTIVPTPTDTTPPGKITDVRMTSELVTIAKTGKKREWTLSWTAPGDDNHQGTASQYLIYYSTTPFTTELPGDARLYPNELSPRPAGSSESLTFDVRPAPSQRRIYYVAIIAVDEVGNRSPLSNVVATR